MNALFKVCMKKNYLLTNIFTKPLVLILGQISIGNLILEITIYQLVIALC